MLSTLIEYFSYSFVQHAFIVGILIALCASLLGVSLVLKRFSYIGDGLSHVAFGAIAIATVFKMNNEILFTLPATAICAILLLRLGKNSKINGDAAIAMLSVGTLAIGYLILSMFTNTANLAGDVCTTLFGATSILTLTKTDLIISVVLSSSVVLLFVLFYNKIFAITFDEDFSTAVGLNVKLYNLIIAVVIAVVIVVAMNLVGSLLISALVIFPAISSMQIFKNYKSVVISSGIIGVFCAGTGIIISIFIDTPIGSTIVLMNIIIFIFCYLYQKAF